MTKVTIFYSSRKYFIKKIPKIYKSFSELVHESDEKPKIFIHKGLTTSQDEDNELPEPEYIENLVIDSDEYSSVNDHVIINFANFIASYKISNLYVQNPPEKLREQIEKAFSKGVEIDLQKYSVISKTNINKFHKNFSKEIIGQDSSGESIATSLIPLLLKNRRKPVVILLYGNSGIGKTESVKLLSKTIGEKLFRKQFSMYQNNEFATYLFGGKHNEKSFAKDLLDRESNVILLDEFDKADPVFFSAFYQLFDEGIFVDKNYSVILEKSIIICTSNFKSEQEIEEKLGSAIFSRFDKLIEFKDLSDEAKRKISGDFFTKLSRNYEKELSITLPENIRNYIEENVSEWNNVREIKNFIEDTLAYYYLTKILNNQ